MIPPRNKSHNNRSMEYFLNVGGLSARELREGIHARLVHMEGMSLAYVDLKQGAVLPVHQHVHEQMTNVLEGELEFTVNGENRICRAGDIVVLPSNVPHGVRAITACRLIDVFQPVREDYK